ncbi:MAG: ATP-binding protein [Isosphaeraceae bacterium]
MTFSVVGLSSEVVTIAAAALVPPREAALFIAGTFVLLTLTGALAYIQALKWRHSRLLGHLQTELNERRRIEAALRGAEGFYHSLVESLPASILRKDVEGRFTFGNHNFYDTLDIQRPEQLEGKTDFDFYPSELAEKYRADDRRVMESNSVLEVVEENMTPHGERRYVQVIKTPLRDVQGNVIGVQGIFWDVTGRKRAEEQLLYQNVKLQEMAESERDAHAALKQAQSQLVQSEKLASLGLIVAGVAHEINNPVAFVSNNVVVLGRYVGEMRDLITLYEEAERLIAEGLPDLAERIAEFRERVDMSYTLENIQGLIQRSRDGLQRIQQIVSHLRLFAHLDEGDVNEADLNEGIESTAAIILGEARKRQVRIEKRLDALPPVTCHAARINQVVLNLMTNAIDACEAGGVVTLSTRREGEKVVLEVSDTGRGIDPAVRGKIFDPFFTTKPIGQGTGLGLSISYGIVKDHGGTISVESELGRGSTFSVTLPIKPVKNPPTSDSKATAEAPEEGATPLAG